MTANKIEGDVHSIWCLSTEREVTCSLQTKFDKDTTDKHHPHTLQYKEDRTTNNYERTGPGANTHYDGPYGTNRTGATIHRSCEREENEHDYEHKF